MLESTPPAPTPVIIPNWFRLFYQILTIHQYAVPIMGMILLALGIYLFVINNISFWIFMFLVPIVATAATYGFISWQYSSIQNALNTQTETAVRLRVIERSKWLVIVFILSLLGYIFAGLWYGALTKEYLAKLNIGNRSPQPIYLESY